MRLVKSLTRLAIQNENHQKRYKFSINLGHTFVKSANMAAGYFGNV
jgi:hypothetical protein